MSLRFIRTVYYIRSLYMQNDCCSLKLTFELTVFTKLQILTSVDFERPLTFIGKDRIFSLNTVILYENYDVHQTFFFFF